MLNQAARMLLIALLSVLLVGFGLCGAYGTFGGLFDIVHGGREGRAFAPVFVMFGLVGLLIAWACWMALSRLWRKRPPSAE